MTSAVKSGKIVAATIWDDGAITMVPSVQELAQLHPTGNLTGSGTLTVVGDPTDPIPMKCPPWPTRAASRSMFSSVARKAT